VRWGRIVGVVALGAVAFAVTTVVALEGVEVVELRTHDSSGGGTRTTRVWIADADGASWVEAANADRPFLRDLEADRRLGVVRGGRERPMRATPEPGVAGHQRIRRLLAEKYGWADTWIGLLADTSSSVAVRLEPEKPED
jgi:hypothetical protein